MPEGKIFLAHSSIDKELIRKLYSELKNKDLDPWLDEEDILPGQNWTLKIPKAIHESTISGHILLRDGYH